MLWLAIWQRVNQYGITERRYFLLILSIWLAAIAIYYSITRSRNIRIIPATLCLTAALTFLGPLSAYSRSEASQSHRLETLLARNGALVGGRIQRVTGPVPFSERREIAATLRYLIETHGTRSVARLFGDSVAAGDSGRLPASAVDQRVRTLMSRAGLDFVGRRQREASRRFRYHTGWGDQSLPVAGFDMLVPVGTARAGAMLDTGVVVVPVVERLVVQVRHARQVLAELDIAGLLDVVDQYARDHPGDTIPHALMKVSADTPAVSVVLFISSMKGVEDDNGRHLEKVEGRALVDLK